MSKVLSVAILVVGVVLLVFGINAHDSPVSSAKEAGKHGHWKSGVRHERSAAGMFSLELLMLCYNITQDKRSHRSMR